MLKSVSVKSAIKDTVEIFQFDQWLRFYFLVEKDGDLWMSIPEDVLTEIKGKREGLAVLADTQNNVKIDYQRNQDAVCTHVAAHLDGQKYDGSILPRVFDHPDFKVEMYMFNVWLKMHEKFLDEGVHPFEEWIEMYQGWNAMDEVKEYRGKLIKSGQDPQSPNCKVTQ